jgi:RNA polymerase sigma-70 factor (ECF subfamily)
MLHFATSFVYIIERLRMSDKTIITVFTRLRRKFLNMAMAILPNEEDAADALQDAFCKLWPRRDTINDETKAEALTGVALRNICIDRMRKREIPTVPIDEEHDTVDSETTYKEREERYNAVKAIIDNELTAQQKRIIELKEIEGVEIEEIAKRMQMTESAVRMNLSRARKKIRECYRKEAANEE